MKKITLLLAVFLLAATANTNAQYKQNKITYNYKEYVPEIGDPYNPGVAGIASFFVPGLGQMFANEGGRGAGFLAGYVGCWVLYGAGVGAMSADIAYDGYYDGGGSGLVLVGLLGAGTVAIWSIVDAVRVSKVNNMAWRARSTSSAVELIPALHLSPQGKAVPALALTLSF